MNRNKSWRDCYRLWTADHVKGRVLMSIYYFVRADFESYFRTFLATYYENLYKLEKILDFMNDLIDIIETNVEDDFSNYSKEMMNMNLELRGWEEDEYKKYMIVLRELCLQYTVGVIKLTKPVDLSNLYISLIEV